MSPDPSGVAAPEEAAAGAGEGFQARFRAGAQRVDQLTAAAVEPESPAPPDSAAHRPRGEPAAGRHRRRVRARKVRRVVRHVDPWSVLKVSALFFASVFLIICVASTLLWNAARTAGAIDDVESFITSLGVFGNCEAIPGQTPTTSTTVRSVDAAGGSLPLPAAVTTTLPPAPDSTSTVPDEDGKCGEGQRLVGGFKFEDRQIFQAFAGGGVVLVLAGSAIAVVMALLFNLISDLTGGVRVTVLEEEPVARRPRRSG